MLPTLTDGHVPVFVLQGLQCFSACKITHGETEVPRELLVVDAADGAGGERGGEGVLFVMPARRVLVAMWVDGNEEQGMRRLWCGIPASGEALKASPLRGSMATHALGKGHALRCFTSS